MYRVEGVYYPARDETRFRVIAKNGRWVAECRSENYANKVRKGLMLDFAEIKKMKNI